MMDITENLQAVRQSIRDAAASCDRDPGSVTLVAVSKRHSTEAIRTAYAAGQRDFGENYAQEQRDKAVVSYARTKSNMEQKGLLDLEPGFGPNAERITLTEAGKAKAQEIIDRAKKADS